MCNLVYLRRCKRTNLNFILSLSDLDTDINSLNQIDNHDLVNAFIKCVSLIDPGSISNSKFSRTMNIADKYRIASDLANAIKVLGYKAEIGYQTFLYFNEKESRRLFLFLFEKLSKQRQDEPKHVTKSLLNRLKAVEIDFSKVRSNDERLRWRTDGIEYLNYFMKNELNDCVQFNNPSLFLEWNTLNSNANSKLFSNFYQNSKLVLNKQSIDLDFRNRKSADNSPSKQTNEDRNRVLNKGLAKSDDSDEQIAKLNEQLKQLGEQLESNERQLKVKEAALKARKDQLDVLNSKFNEKKFELDKVKYSDKSNEELKEGIVRMNDELSETNQKWQLFNLKYDESVNELKEKTRSIITKFNEINEEIQLTKSQIELSNLKLKKIDEQTVELEQSLDEDNDLDRKFYTKRIFEIINNVKKQEQDIDKILVDIRNLQREINQLTGKVTRTYTVVEETVFKHSNLTDYSKTCYKLISELDATYDKLINEIESCGQTKREILRFEEIVSIVCV